MASVLFWLGTEDCSRMGNALPRCPLAPCAWSDGDAFPAGRGFRSVAAAAPNSFCEAYLSAASASTFLAASCSACLFLFSSSSKARDGSIAFIHGALAVAEEVLLPDCAGLGSLLLLLLLLLSWATAVAGGWLYTGPPLCSLLLWAYAMRGAVRVAMTFPLSWQAHDTQMLWLEDVCIWYLVVSKKSSAFPMKPERAMIVAYYPQQLRSTHIHTPKKEPLVKVQSVMRYPR